MTVVRDETRPVSITGRDEGVEDVRRALNNVMDPELDEPITSLGFVRSVDVMDTASGSTVIVHLRLPTSFCSPNFAYLMASDAKDAITGLPWVGKVTVELDEHHDSEMINAGLAADAGFKGTFGHEAEKDLEELRATFRRKAHDAAMERSLVEMLRQDSSLAEGDLGNLRLRQLPHGRQTDALRRRRAALGLTEDPDAHVLVDYEGHTYLPEQVPMAIRRARSTRVSIDGNAHFCRGLLRTRYEGSGSDQSERLEGVEPADHHHLLSIRTKENHQ